MGADALHRESTRWRGRVREVDAIHVGNQVCLISGRLLRIARLKDEWREDLQRPEQAVERIRATRCADLLVFWQRVPELEPKFGYWHEWSDVAAIPISTYEDWFSRQINGKTRNMIRKASKLGVICDAKPFDDELVKGIKTIFDESPVRRGKPFWHFGKDLLAIKEELGSDLDAAMFIGAYYHDELIGFIKLLVADRYAMITMILDKTSRRHLSPMNALIAKAVDVSAGLSIPFLTYTTWRAGEHGQFQERNGFQRLRVPQYFVPTSRRGETALRLGLHRSLKETLPEPIVRQFLNARAKWYEWRYDGHKARTAEK